MADHPPGKPPHGLTPPPMPAQQVPSQTDMLLLKILDRLDRMENLDKEHTLAIEVLRNDVYNTTDMVKRTKQITEETAHKQALSSTTIMTPIHPMQAIQHPGIVQGESSELALLKQRLAIVEKAADETDAQRIAELEKERDELKDARKHWGRYVIAAIVTLFSGAILFMLGRLVR